MSAVDQDNYVKSCDITIGGDPQLKDTILLGNTEHILDQLKKRRYTYRNRLKLGELIKKPYTLRNEDYFNYDEKSTLERIQNILNDLDKLIGTKVINDKSYIANKRSVEKLFEDILNDGSKIDSARNIKPGQNRMFLINYYGEPKLVCKEGEEFKIDVEFGNEQKKVDNITSCIKYIKNHLPYRIFLYPGSIVILQLLIAIVHIYFSLWIYPEQQDLPDYLQLLSITICSIAVGTLGSTLRDRGIFKYDSKNRFYGHLRPISIIYISILFLETFSMLGIWIIWSFLNNWEFTREKWELISYGSIAFLLLFYCIITLYLNVDTKTYK